MKSVTRTQLRGYGATEYQAIAITKNLVSHGKKNRVNVYELGDVVGSIREILNNPRIALKTRTALDSIQEVLLERLGNVINVPFQSPKGTDLELSGASKMLVQTLAKTEGYFNELKADVATIKGKRL